MRNRLFLQLASLLTVVIGQALAQQKVMMCYFTNWSQYRHGKNFFPENVNTNYCTHLVYSFAKVSGNRLAPYEWNDIVSYNVPSGLYYRFNKLKTQNPALKTLLAVGGWNHGGRPFSAMTSTLANRQQFVNTTITFLRNHGFDGLDIDWEYPADPERGGVPEDKANFAALIRELRAGFNAEARSTGNTRLLLTAAVAAGYSKVTQGYDIPTLSRDLDFINLMAYDLHGSWDRRTGHNAGLYTSSTDPENYSVSAVALNWARSADRRKINVGLATYGRTWKLTNPASNGVGAATSGPGAAGTYTGSAGTLSYYEVCGALNRGYVRRFDSQTKTPYAFKGDQWITYDDVVSMQYKMTWIRQNGFGGSIVWSLDLDDFDGAGCGSGPYPLISVIHQCLVQGRNCAPNDGGTLPLTTRPPFFVTTTTPTTTTPIAVPVTTPTYSGNPDCPYYPGTFRDRYYCAKFWMCFSPPRQQYLFTCQYPTVFDPVHKICNHRNRVNCTGLLL
ncbi:chitinase-3-like protein 1 [Babylonia areolata]|uniref:chitinase-3-like protein 1 n=1 Tax=Babylonia areolata TaxID=304850 RepID=UPI003FCF66EF